MAIFFGFDIGPAGKMGKDLEVKVEFKNERIEERDQGLKRRVGKIKGRQKKIF